MIDDSGAQIEHYYPIPHFLFPIFYSPFSIFLFYSLLPPLLRSHIKPIMPLVVQSQYFFNHVSYAAKASIQW